MRQHQRAGIAQVSRTAWSTSSSSRSLAMPAARIFGPVLRTRSARMVRRECPIGEMSAFVHLLGAEEYLGQPVPGRVRWVAHGPAAIRLQRRNPASRAGQPHHLSDQRRRIRDVDQKCPGMHQIVGGRGEARPVGISLHHLDMGQATLRRKFAGQGHIGRIEVQADDPAFRAYPIGQQIQDSAGPAAQVDRPPPLGDPNPVQQQLAVVPQLGGLTPKPVTFRGTAAQRIDNTTRRLCGSWADRAKRAVVLLLRHSREHGPDWTAAPDQGFLGWSG
jgi:hypothetical protein